MAVVIASALGINVGGKPLFEDVSFKLEPGDRMTLAGRNGAGKSTLLRILAGELSLESGALRLEKGARVALHDQRPPRDSGMALGEYVLGGCAAMFEVEEELARLEGKMGTGADDGETMRAYARAQARLEAGGGYRWRDQVLIVLRGLGFDEDQAERPLDSFSGGELTRASLARALATRPELLLLDEPTNHLDIASLEWLEGFLTSIDAAVVLVAHDRWFLEAVGTCVLELEAGRGRYFAGPWHAWRQEQAARELALGRAIDRQEAEIARMERFVERFRAKASKARQAQSRVKQIQKAKRDAVAADPRDNRKLRFSFAPPERPGRVVLSMKGVSLEVPGRTLLSGANLEIERGEHVVLVGPNGAGKTTLIETLAGALEPAAGAVRQGHGVKLGYLSQHAETASGSGTVLDAAQRETGLTGQKVRSLLGGFLFSGGDANKSLGDISGGEQRRLSLAILVASGANVLILDEPTNHLDIESREALEDALSEYEGAVLLVSHDRALLEAIGSRTLVLENGELRSHDTRWADYEPPEPEEAPVAAKSNGAGRQAVPKGPSKNAVQNLRKLEGQVEKAEAALRELEDEMAEPGLWSDADKAADMTDRHARAKGQLESLYERWEKAQVAVGDAA
ncbi:MAG: ATP-binding cassette, subfamily er 3 [Thermoleophilaceae bacterium]|jgi:ATP-binding cassette subfamily F protein 3|nr:ATP-binding cassette, subfamily er 3 [Thermoleophilaceae bacterium]